MLHVSIPSFSYHDSPILTQIQFSIAARQHVSILGESGSGKSTLLHLIYGLHNLNDGEILWNNTPILGPKYNLVPGMPFMKLVEQDFNLMPFTTVQENVATHLSRQNVNEDNKRVQELLNVVGLSTYSNTLIKHLSGGQKQRVALAKALANEPTVLLLDEPFSHIDSSQKNRLRRSLYAYLKKKGITCITATHDSKQALSFSDEILIIKMGELVQKGVPETIYNNPVSKDQASLFDEVSYFPKGLLASQKSLFYPSELCVSTSKTNVLVTIKDSYFMGNTYLIQAHFKNDSVFFNSKSSLKQNSTVYLTTVKNE